MPALMHSDQEFNDMYCLWQLEGHSKNWPLYKSPEAEILVRNAAFNISNSQISISHFILAFDGLVKDGTITQLRAPKPAPKLFTLTAAQYHAMPSDEVRRRRHDPEFVQAVETLISAGQI